MVRSYQHDYLSMRQTRMTPRAIPKLAENGQEKAHKASTSLKELQATKEWREWENGRNRLPASGKSTPPVSNQMVSPENMHTSNVI